MAKIIKLDLLRSQEMFEQTQELINKSIEMHKRLAELNKREEISEYLKQHKIIRHEVME